jgi:hypothetical protein
MEFRSFSSSVRVASKGFNASRRAFSSIKGNNTTACQANFFPLKSTATYKSKQMSAASARAGGENADEDIGQAEQAYFLRIEVGNWGILIAHKFCIGWRHAM